MLNFGGDLLLLNVKIFVNLGIFGCFLCYIVLLEIYILFFVDIKIWYVFLKRKEYRKCSDRLVED